MHAKKRYPKHLVALFLNVQCRRAPPFQKKKSRGEKGGGPKDNVVVPWETDLVIILKLMISKGGRIATF